MASRIDFTDPPRPPKASLIGTNSPRLRCMAHSPMFPRLPEVVELVKGVSIDDYSTFRATRFSEPV